MKALTIGFIIILVLAVAAQTADLDQLSDRARQALAEKHWADAAESLEKLAKLAPGVAEVQANLGLAYYSMGRPAEAERAFAQGLKLNPKLPQVKLMLGLCYADLGRSREAVEILEPAFRHPPDKEIGRLVGLSLERAYSDLKQFTRSTAVSDELLERYPNDPEILFESSRLHAERSYQLMSQLRAAAPDSAWIHYANAEVQESAQRYDLARSEYEAAAKMEPRLPGLHFRLGRTILLSSKDPQAADAALKEFEQELAIAPRNSDAEYEIGEIYRERGQLEPAREHFSRAVSYHPEFVEARIGLARTLMKLGKAQEALPHLREAARIDPENKLPHFLLASAYRSIGDSASARKEFAEYQKLRAANTKASVRAPGTVAAQEITE